MEPPPRRGGRRSGGDGGSDWSRDRGAVMASGFRLPASGFRLPASGFRLPASGFRLPASGFRLYATATVPGIRPRSFHPPNHPESGSFLFAAAPMETPPRASMHTLYQDIKLVQFFDKPSKLHPYDNLSCPSRTSPGVRPRAEPVGIPAPQRPRTADAPPRSRRPPPARRGPRPGPAPDPLPVSPPARQRRPGSAGGPSGVRPAPPAGVPASRARRAPSQRFTGRLRRAGRARFTTNGRHAASASPQRLRVRYAGQPGRQPDNPPSCAPPIPPASCKRIQHFGVQHRIARP